MVVVGHPNNTSVSCLCVREVVMFRPSLAWKPGLWPGRAQAFQNLRPGPHAGLGLGLSLAWPKPWPGSIIFSKKFLA